MWNYSLKIPLLAVFCAEGWGAGGDGATDFSFSPDCDVLSSFLSLPFFCCFFSFLKRCFSSFVNSLPSFCTTTAQWTHYSLDQKGPRRDLNKFWTRTFARSMPSFPWEPSAKTSSAFIFNHTDNQSRSHIMSLNVPDSTKESTQISLSVTADISSDSCRS